ncbi:hypothetical protein [Streptomyces orinoci]|uniref:Uncharacterized protein n=1 Tax=Streptomyces orinoci TaxID=67339 RepID=A0ABV3JXZ6_STRON|nr:hypothetical protein [Streptomyces orinoci]
MPASPSPVPSPGRDQWCTAVTRLFDEITPFVRTGPRNHQDWRKDALAVFAREVDDPRGWLSLDMQDARDQYPDAGGPFPFRPLTVDFLSEHLHPVESEAAAELLVVMLDDWFSVRGVWNFEERKEQLLADAHTVIARYGPAVRCYTSSPAARTTSRPHFLDPRSENSGYNFTGLIGDVGLIAVTDDEVGVIWAFNYR